MIRRNGHINLKIDHETAKALTDQAKARGMSLNVYLKKLAKGGANGSRRRKPKLSGRAFDKLLDDFFAKHPERLPALPDDFSRADIYYDHD